ncbi:MAG: glycosyltransferase family 39 protein [Deltaproteobacteria bacterium]|nr:glycosyltransferase family 39 protein [Deltaproteobacteria bacterium]MBW2360462.1 glycosyltransferase family 39 protein [Deltaproteobacteria bacterium]
MSQRAAAQSREALLVAGLVLAPLLPFLGKAFSIDTPVFVAVARQIVAAPLDPFGFEMFWDETSLAAAVFNRNPPLLSYWLAPWLALFGEHEWLLHAATLVFPLVAALAFLGIARRLCGAGVAPAVLLVTSPAFVVLATTLLLDVPVLACMLLAVYALLRGSDAGAARWQWGAGAAVAAAGLMKYVGFSAAPLVGAGALLLCERRGVAFARVMLPPLLVWSGWALWTQQLYGAVHFFGSTDVVAQRSYAMPLFGNQATSAFIWYGGALVFPVVLWARTLLRAGRGLEVALLALGVGAAAVVFLVTDGEPARRHAIDLGHTVLAIVCCAGGAFLWLAVLRPREALATPEDAFLSLWLGGLLVFSLFVNWHINAADALLAAPPALLLWFRRPELRPSAAWVRGCVVGMLLLSIGLAVADTIQANFYRSVARRIVEEIGDAPGARWFVGNWGFQHYLVERGFRPVLPIALGESRLAEGDWLAAPRNVAQQEIGVHQQLYEVVETGSFERAGDWPLRTTNPDAGAGFYSHRLGYTPFAWSRRAFETVQLGRVVAVKAPVPGVP